MPDVRADAERAASQVGCQSLAGSLHGIPGAVQGVSSVCHRDGQGRDQSCVDFDETALGGSHFDSVRVSDIIDRLDEVENEGGLHLVNFKYGGKRKPGASPPTDPSTEPPVDEDGDVEPTRRSTHQGVAPVEWCRTSANMFEIADLCEPKAYKDAVTGSDQLHWKAAIAAELRSMDDREFFIQSTLPTGQRVIDTR